MRFQINKAMHKWFFMILREYHKYLFSLSWKNYSQNRTGLHVYTSLRTRVAPVNKKMSASQSADTISFQNATQVKFSSQRMQWDTKSISPTTAHKSLYSFDTILYTCSHSQSYIHWPTGIHIDSGKSIFELTEIKPCEYLSK